MKHYFEDFQVGDIFEFGSRTVSEEEMIAFAKQFDPQPIHIDPEQAKDSVFGGIIASGWYTAGIFMRLFTDEVLNKAASIASPGIEELRWLKPVRPGDTLRVRCTLLASTSSKSRPGIGIIRSKSEVFNQADEVVMSLVATNFFHRRPDRPAGEP